MKNFTERMLKKFFSRQNYDVSDIADFLRNRFKEKYQGDWQCIIGNDVTYSIIVQQNFYALVKVKDEYDVLIFKTTESD